MTDLSTTIEANSKQLNADDLLGGPRTITITKVSANPSSNEQPIAISYEGDSGKPFYPCKTVRRLLISVWQTADGQEYVGRKMTLFRDPDVMFGGLKTGGIRISHMSHIEKPITAVLTATRGNKKPVTVQPLIDKPEPTHIDIYAKEFGAALKTDTATIWWDETTKRRDALNIPADRLDKMVSALAAKTNPKGDDGGGS